MADFVNEIREQFLAYEHTLSEEELAQHKLWTEDRSGVEHLQEAIDVICFAFGLPHVDLDPYHRVKYAVAALEELDHYHKAFLLKGAKMGGAYSETLLEMRDALSEVARSLGC